MPGGGSTRVPAEGARLVAGLLLSGYGALVLLRVLAHESPVVGGALLAAGVALVLWGRGGRAPRGAQDDPSAAPSVPPLRRALVAAAGALAAGGVLGYNAWVRSSLEVPELALLAYGLALVAAAPRLHARLARVRVTTLVAWSFPLVAAPLGLYALDALIDAQVGVGSSPLDRFIAHGLVAPMAILLHLFGLDAAAMGQVVALTTPRGRMFLTVGAVCAGLHAGVLFLGIFGMYAWQERTPPGRLAMLLALGLVGVYLANLLRLVALALVGYRWGGDALQTAHAHAGWILFVAWMIGYWWLVLTRLQGPGRARSAA